MTITVALPDDTVRERLSPAPDGVEFVTWSPGDDPIGRIDMLVLGYMGQSNLPALAGQPIGLIQGQSLGYDGVAAQLPAGMTYSNAVEVHEASTAELALALVLASVRGIPSAVINQQTETWSGVMEPGLAKRRVLLLGVGGVGGEIRARLEPFDVQLTLVARTARDDIHGLDELPGLLPDADIVIIAVPLTAGTTKLVDAAFLGHMKRGALLVNVSRGKIVDTDALVDALQSGAVTAALDVTEPEPLPAGHPLWAAPGLLLTPHVGGNTGAMAGRMDRLIREQIRRLLAGEPPANVVVSS